jgi:hypothetical protein
MMFIVRVGISGVVFGLSLLLWLQTSVLITPFNPSIPENTEVSRISQFFQIQTTLAQKIVEISRDEGLPSSLVAALIYSESSFRPNAVSSKNYYGLAQVPWHIPYQDINIRLGTRILKEKLQITRGDLLTALKLYKGYELDDPRGHEQAQKVINLMKQLERQQR